MKLRWAAIIGLAVAATLVAIAVRDRTPLRSEFCVAEVGDTRAQVDLEQARWTSLMAAIGQRRGLSPRATTIAIATAYQESKIHNIDYGDRDSVGLFQQRPSQGWGTVEQIMDPAYSIDKFYEELEKVGDYENLEITDAAQQVQRSAYPEAYADHESYGRALASALRGYSPGQFTCRINPGDAGSATVAADDVKAAFALDTLVEGDDVQVPLVGEALDVNARGWAVAHYFVANAARLGLNEVRFDRLVWNAERSDEGWVSNSQVAADIVIASTN